jgi:hypothetical protein
VAMRIKGPITKITSYHRSGRQRIERAAAPKCDGCGGSLVKGEVYNGGAGRRLCNACGQRKKCPLVKYKSKSHPVVYPAAGALEAALVAILSEHCGEAGGEFCGGLGTSEGAVETLKRIIRERNEAKASALFWRETMALAKENAEAAIDLLRRFVPKDEDE